MIIIPDSFLDICIAISTSVITLFIPLFYSVVIRLDEKYESRLIIKSFWSEKVVRWFIITSILLVLSAIIYSLKLKPIFWNNSFWMNNSAALLTGLILLTSITLGLYSVFRLNKYQDPVQLFDLIKNSKSISEKEKRIIRFDLLFHSIKDLNYNKDFSKSINDDIHNEILSINRREENLPIEYYDALEQLTSLVFSNNLNNDTRHNRHVVLSLWSYIFFGKFPLSENSYSWLWYHLSLAVEYERDELVIRHWERAHGMIKMKGLRSHRRDYRELSPEILATDKNDSDEFIRFHIVLGALLLYTEKNKLLQNCLKYTSSWPPDYYLLPKGSQQIIEIFQYFNDPYDRNYISISSKFSFPGSSGFEQDQLIKGRINQYLILLLFRNKIDLIDKPIFNFNKLNKFQCGDYVKALDKLLLELTERIDLNSINRTLERQIKITDIDVLKTKIVQLKADITTYRQTLMSSEALDSKKINEFCSSIESYLKNTLNELEKLNFKNDGNNVLNYPGIINTVDKDFFVADSEVSYLDYEKSFSSMFIENLKMKLGYIIQQSAIANYTLKPENVTQIFRDLDTKIIAINFGVLELEGIISENLIQLGHTYNVTPRVFIFVNAYNESASITFDPPELCEDYTNSQFILENKVIIGVERLSKGKLSDRFKDAISDDVDLDNTIGIEIGANITLTVSNSFKCICLIEHQEYRESKDPDEISISEIIDLIS